MSAQVLPETAAVYWRPRVDARSLERRGRVWTLTTIAHTIPFCAAAIVLFVLEPLFLHDWFRRRTARDATATLRLVHRLHIGLLVLSLVTIAGAVAGAHGMI